MSDSDKSFLFIQFSFFLSSVGKKLALLVFQRLPVCRQKPNVLFVRLAFSAWHTTVTCKLSLRIARDCPSEVRMTIGRESGIRHRTDSAMQFAKCYALFFLFLAFCFSTIFWKKLSLFLNDFFVPITFPSLVSI